MIERYLNITVMTLPAEYHRIGYIVLGRLPNAELWLANETCFKTLEDAGRYAKELALVDVIPLIVEVGCPHNLAWPNNPKIDGVIQ